MTRVSMTEDEATQWLAQAFCAVETPAEARVLIEDLLTPREVLELAQRLEVARLLDEGTSYVGVSAHTGASSTTVSRVSKCLGGGSGGYRLVLDRMKGLGKR